MFQAWNMIMFQAWDFDLGLSLKDPFIRRRACFFHTFLSYDY